MRSHPKASVLVVALFALLAFAAPAANAATSDGSYAQIGQIGGTGNLGGGEGVEDGQFETPNQADVNDTSGVLYVADTLNDRVQAFTPTETGGDFSAKVAITAPTGLAVDQATGDVYVANASGISKFTAALSPAAGWSDPGVSGALAVDPTTGDLLVADQDANLIRRFNSNGSADGSFAAERPVDLAVDSTGDILAITSTGELVDPSCATTSALIRYSGAGIEEGPVGSLYTPGQVDVNPANDEVFVAAPVNGYYCNNATPSLVTFDSAGAETGADELPEAIFGVVPGLAVRSEAAPRVYAVVRSPVERLYVNSRVTVLEQIFPPQVTLDPVSAITGSGADFDGSVDANGLATEYRFEISADGGNNWSTAASGSAGEATDPVAVEATATGLEPGGSYLVRLIATNADGEASGGPEGFQTTALPPEVVGQGATTTVNEATLEATIKTGNAPTEYRFEYGPTAAYGESTPTRVAKATPKQSAVSATVGGLTPDASYHFRVVLENSEGAEAGEDQTFTTRALPGSDACPNAPIRAAQDAQYLPDCRAYEMVSPVDKNGVDISDGRATRASALGNAVGFMSSGNFDNNGTGWHGYSTYIYDRTSEGWGGKGIDIYQDSNFLNTFDNNSNTFSAFTEDLSRGIVLAREPFPGPAAAPGTSNIFVWDRLANAYESVTPNASGTPVAFTEKLPNFAGATPEFDHVVFNAGSNLTANASGSNWKAYHWHEGALELVGIAPGPSATPFDHAVIGNRAVTGQKYASGGEHPISEDGSKVFFTDVSSGLWGRVYMRLDNEQTILINEDENPAEDVPLGDAQFMLATPEGGAAFFLTRQRLVEADQDDEDAAGTDLYRYDTTVPPGGSNLTLISDPAQLPPVNKAGDEGIVGVLGASEDGSRVYFARSAGFDFSEGGAQSAGELWAFDDGQLDKAADVWTGPTYPSDRSSFPWGANAYDRQNWNPSERDALTTPDGRFLLFRTVKQQDDAFDNVGTAQMYLYDAADGSRVCVSCKRGSDRASTSATIYFPGSGAVPEVPHPSRALSADGRTVFFSSREALVARDSNGQFDAYAYDVASGRVALLSSGTGRDYSQFQAASADGKTAFILTRDRLVASDRDDLRDLYAVRVGGGFPEPDPAPALCEGDGCQSAGPRAPEFHGAGSSANRGLGNVAGRRNCSALTKKAVKAKQRLNRAEGKAQKAKAKRALRSARGKAKSCRKGGNA